METRRRWEEKENVKVPGQGTLHLRGPCTIALQGNGSQTEHVIHFACRGLGICISNKLPSDIDGADLGTTTTAIRV